MLRFQPAGKLRGPQVAPSPHAFTVYDHAYYWPHFTPIGAPVTDHLTNNSIGLFTLSKLTGHGSTRVGWAVVRDAHVRARRRPPPPPPPPARPPHLRHAPVARRSRAPARPATRWLR